MLERFSKSSVKIIEKAKALALEEYEISQDNYDFYVESNYLLQAMFISLDTVCHFLLVEEDIKLEEIIKKKSLMRKEEKRIGFSKQFEEIVKLATKISKQKGSKYVYDEHLFKASIEHKDNQICDILTSLGLDLKLLNDDIEDIYYKDEDPDLSYLQKIKENKLIPYIKINDYQQKLLYILNKMNKQNALIIGPEGCGKTALVASISSFTIKDIYTLHLTSLISGTKYRGEMEEKLINAINYCLDNDIIMFIDEIHTVINCGGGEGSLDVANILKPYLSNNDLNVIGCTTYQEYYKYLEKDAAFLRRFELLFIEEPNYMQVLKILKGIKHSFENFYNVKITNKELEILIKNAKKIIFNRYSPDKEIDLLDKVLSVMKVNNLSFLKSLSETIDLVTNRKIYFHKIQNMNLYKVLKKNNNNLGIIDVKDKMEFQSIFKDLQKLFNITNKQVLTIDQNEFNTKEALSTLIGTNKGYVGYEEEGRLYKHLLRNLHPVIYIINYHNDKGVFSLLLNKLINNPFVYDNHDRLVVLTSTIFILEQSQKSSIGFI